MLPATDPTTKMDSTAKMPNQVKKASYAQSGQIRNIRKKMVEIMVNESQKCDLNELVQKFIPEHIAGQIEKACTGIFPLQNVYPVRAAIPAAMLIERMARVRSIRKAKVLKKPKFDLVKLMEIYADTGDSGGLDQADKEVLVENQKGSGARL